MAKNSKMNKSNSQTIEVQESQTAESLGSGLLAVFSTPALIALMENTAMKIIELTDDLSSVGTFISVHHLKASPVGESITCKAQLTENEGRKYKFAIQAFDSSGELIGEGIHERFVINIEKFMAKLK